VRVNGRSFVIVGVAPRQFGGAMTTGVTPALWVTLAHAPSGAIGGFGIATPNHLAQDLLVIGRVAPGVSSVQAADRLRPRLQEVDRVLGSDRSHPYTAPDVTISSLSDVRSLSGIGDLLPIALAMPVLLLLVACTNLANLTLSRGAAVRTNSAIRRALGASRWDLLRIELLEGLVIAAVGGLVGGMVASGLLSLTERALQGFRGTALQSLAAVPLTLDPRALVAAGGLAVLSMLVATLTPAIELTRPFERVSTKAVSNVAPRWTWRRRLIALQVWVSLSLLLLMSLGVQMIQEEHRLALSGNPDQQVVQVQIPYAIQNRDETNARGTTARIVQTLEGQAAITTVGLRARASGWSMKLSTMDRPFGADGSGMVSLKPTLLSPTGLSLLRIQMAHGRWFTDGDDSTRPPVLVVSESVARTLFSRTAVTGAEVRGRTFDTATQTWIERDYEVIGVTRDTVRNRRVEDAVYAPFAQHYFGEVSILATSRRPDDAVSMLRSAVRSVDPNLAVAYVGRLDPERWAGFLAAQRLTWIAGALGLIALVLAMTGLYGVLAHITKCRTREIGIRMALGADSGRVMFLVFRDGLRPVVEGMTLGTLTAVLLRILLQTQSTTPLTFGSIAVLLATSTLLLAALLACYLPARRAASVEPSISIRDL
jgi:putative ABC transport system permease protein